MSLSIRIEENGKDLPSNYNYDDLSRRRRPVATGASSGCNFNGIRGGKYKTEGTGRTFFDLQFVNVGYNHNYNINCGGGHPGGGGGHPAGDGINKPILGGNKPFHKPILGGQIQQGGHQGGQFLSNKPILSMLVANRPLQGIFSQSQAQSQSDSQTGVISGAISGIASLLPGPQDIGQGLGDGISSFLQTLPQIGQSFQSLLPSFGNFPSLPSLPPLTQGSQSISGNIPVTQSPNPGVGIVTPVAPDPTDPDDTIYNDNVKPVHEDHDPITDPFYNNKLPPGSSLNRRYEQNRYRATQNYNNQRIHDRVNRNKYHYQQNKEPYGGQIRPQFRQGGDAYGQYEGRSRYPNEEGREKGGFRFPSS